MLTKNDLQQIRGLIQAETRAIVQEETRAIIQQETRAIVQQETRAIVQQETRAIIQEELQPVKKDIASMKKKLHKVSKDVDALIPHFDKRITQLENGMRLLQQN